MKTAPRYILSLRHLFHKKLGSTFKSTREVTSGTPEPHNLKTVTKPTYDICEEGLLQSEGSAIIF